MNSLVYNDFGWVDPPKEIVPKVNHRDTRIAPALARRIASACGAADVPLVQSYLVQCSDEEDARKSLLSLRQNRPELWPAAKTTATKTGPTRVRSLRSK
jgi:hypothetical protein